MKKTSAFFLWLILLPVLIAAFLPGFAQARLGEASASVAADQKSFSARKKAVQNFPAYSVHEIKNETMTIRQYISPSDVVFGIAWTGLTQPDLKELLGAYAPEYQKTVKKIRRQPGQRYSKTTTSDVVVEKWGHLRKMGGRAYVPALMPDGVSADEIQ